MDGGPSGRRARQSERTSAAPAKGSTTFWTHAIRSRLVAGFLVAFLGYFCVNGGLFTWLPAVQIGLFVGVLAGAICPTPRSAASVAAAAAFAGFAVEPANRVDSAGYFSLDALASIVVIVIVAAACAALLARLRAGRASEIDHWLRWAVLLLLVVNLALTSASLAYRGPFLPGQTLVQVLDAPAVKGGGGDVNFYRRVVEIMRSGKSYYPAFQQAYRENPAWGTDPTVVANVRPPVLFWFWSVMPRGAAGVLVPMVLLGCSAVVASSWVTRPVVPDCVSLVASAGLASYFLFFSVSNGVFFSEQWVGALAVLCAACMAVALGVPNGVHAKAWLCAAVFMAVLAVCVRELGVFLLVAGLASSWFVEAGGLRRFSVAAWLGGAGVTAVAAWAHFGAAFQILAPGVASRGGGYARWFTGGGPSQLLSAVRWGSLYFGQHAIGAFTLAAMGVVGAWMIPSRSLRVFAVIAVTLPFVAFLFVGSDFAGSIGEPSVQVTQHLNYWGPIVVPLAFAVAPGAFALLPPLRRLQGV